jgi:hypothetical protein
MENFQTAALALTANPDDADSRRNFHAALDKVLDARKALADARLQARSKTKTPMAVAQDQRYLSVHNETNKPLTLWVQVYAKDDKGAWGWLPGEVSQDGKADNAVAYHLDPGQSAYLEHQGRKLAGSKIRFWLQWQGGEFTKYRTHDLWLVPEVDGGEHIYRAAAMQTYPLKLTP